MAVIPGVPIKVQIGLRANGHHDHPNWDLLPLAAVRDERPEDHQIVKWHYDKVSGHDQESPGSPRGVWFGMMVVTSVMASEAVATFPGIVTIMSDAEAQDFWENFALINQPDDDMDTDRLIALKARRDLMVAVESSPNDINQLDIEIRAALDRNDRGNRGVVKNPRRRWNDAKDHFGFTVA